MKDWLSDGHLDGFSIDTKGNIVETPETQENSGLTKSILDRVFRLLRDNGAIPMDGEGK